VLHAKHHMKVMILLTRSDGAVFATST